MRSGSVSTHPGVHGGAVQKEGHAEAHTVLQTLHAGVGLTWDRNRKGLIVKDSATWKTVAFSAKSLSD